MTQLHPTTVAIRQLRLRGGADVGSAQVKRDAVRLRQEIEWVDWPAAPGESWVFIRRLHVRASLMQVACQLARNLREQLQGGSGDNVVRFANLTELLTALLTDLVRGGASGRWYWQRWSHLFTLPLPLAVASLLKEHIVYLPAVCARLSQQRALESVWLALDEASACQLRQELAFRCGVSLPQWEAVQQEQARTRHAPTPETELRISQAVRLRWVPLLQRLPMLDARYQLGLMVIGQEVAPLMLQQAPATLLSRLTRVFVSLDNQPVASHAATTSGLQPPQPVARPRDTDSDDGFAATIARETTEARIDIQPETFLGIVRQATSPRQNPSVPAEITHATSQSVITPVACLAAGSVCADAFSRGQDDPPAVRIAQPAPSPFQALRLNREPHDLSFDQFNTHQGGLLYLLNMLNRSEAQTLMGDHWEELPSGWGWLYRLGQELQLDETDPIITFLATQLGFDHPAAPAPSLAPVALTPSGRSVGLELLPSLPARAELLALARRWYGRAGLWQPALLQLTARIHYSPSHVDLYAPLSAVRLPVRLAGLDINPGWLPWLGRVVIFHYE